MRRCSELIQGESELEAVAERDPLIKKAVVRMMRDTKGNTTIFSDNNGYLGSVEYSAADEVFFGRIVGITDHVTYDGDSVQSLKRCFEEAVEDYIESCSELGKEPEKSYNGKRKRAMGVKYSVTNNCFLGSHRFR